MFSAENSSEARRHFWQFERILLNISQNLVLSFFQEWLNENIRRDGGFFQYLLLTFGAVYISVKFFLKTAKCNFMIKDRHDNEVNAMYLNF